MSCRTHKTTLLFYWKWYSCYSPHELQLLVQLFTFYYCYYFFRYKFFAIQYYGECWSGPNAGSTYARDGTAKNCFKGVVGVSHSNFVYQFVN